jgi:hypothetical protein
MNIRMPLLWRYGILRIYFFKYSLRSILLFDNMDVSTTKMCLDTYILAKSNMGRREYMSAYQIKHMIST